MAPSGDGASHAFLYPALLTNAVQVRNCMHCLPRHRLPTRRQWPRCCGCEGRQSLHVLRLYCWFHPPCLDGVSCVRAAIPLGGREVRLELTSQQHLGHRRRFSHSQCRRRNHRLCCPRYSRQTSLRSLAPTHALTHAGDECGAWWLLGSWFELGGSHSRWG